RPCGADVKPLKKELDAYLDEHLERVPDGRDVMPQQTLGFQRILQRAAAHVQSSGRDEVNGQNVLVAIFREPDSQAAFLLEQQGIRRLDVITYLSHGISKIAEGPGPSERGGDEEGEEDGDEAGGAGRRAARDPLAAFTIDLVERAAAGRIDPLIGRSRELE